MRHHSKILGGRVDKNRKSPFSAQLPISMFAGIQYFSPSRSPFPCISLFHLLQVLSRFFWLLAWNKATSNVSIDKPGFLHQGYIMWLECPSIQIFF